MSNKTVIIYTTTTCPYCTQAKNYLRDCKVEYTEFNVATDFDARQDMVRKSGQLGVPVLDIDGQIVVGFNRNRIFEMLNKGDEGNV